MEREPEAEGVRTGQDDLHSLGGIDVGEKGGGINEFWDQCHLIQQHIPEAGGPEAFHIPVQSGHGIQHRGLDISGFRRVLRGHVQHCLPKHGGLSSAAEAEEQAHPVILAGMEIGV